MSEEHFPVVLERYGTEGAKEQAISMALKQFGEVTEATLHSVLCNLESDLAHMFPRLTEEEKAEKAKEKEYYQKETADMEPYMMDGKQMEVDIEGFLVGEEMGYPVWRNKEGQLMSRISLGLGDYMWLNLKEPLKKMEIEEPEDNIIWEYEEEEKD